MLHRKMIEEQLKTAGVRLGDSCSILPFHGKKKAFTLNRNCIDLISSQYRPGNLCRSYIELPNSYFEHFHYRLELDDSAPKNARYVLKTITGKPFWLNGLAAKEAYVERQDHLFLDDNKINFDPCNLGELTKSHFDHPVLLQDNLMKSHLNILIEGETGCGKTYVASKIHEKSLRSGPFISLNLSSFNPQLIESELFGHKKGSFTGAVADKVGALSLCDHGTLFLDEVDSLPLEAQTKLLTFLDNQKFRRVGDMKEISVSTRLIFASGRRLQYMVDQGSFRKDLYYRLRSGHSVELPSLRNDISKIKEACQFYALKNQVSFSVNVIEFYQTLAWPGNLRQLFGHLDKKKILSKTTKMDFDSVDEELLKESSDLQTIGDFSDLISMEKFKSDYAKKALAACNGNIAMVSRKLHLSEKTVRSLLLNAN